jgi:hypothetical protein
MAIETELIDNLTTSAINIVYFGFEITAGILDYLRANYVESIAGLVVLGILLGLIWAGTRKSNPLAEVKSMTKF